MGNDRSTVDVGALEQACRAATEWPLPGHGDTQRRLELLTTACLDDIALGRLVEAHADALAILAELKGRDPQPMGGRWGVWAAGPANSVTGSWDGGGWVLDGVKGWCSGATLLTAALVDVATKDGQRLMAVSLDDPGIDVDPPEWAADGMSRTDTRRVWFQGVRGLPIGHPDDYLRRPGFWMGAVGVAACWHGGAIAIARALLRASKTEPDRHRLVHLAAVHVALTQNDALLREAARRFDIQPLAPAPALALTVRHGVERNAMAVIDRVGRALGPRPLVTDRNHWQRVADLLVYVRQDHAEADLERLGEELVRDGVAWA
jgi:alkylation response protein AidB-like acyl-CoA dehydrogenase